LPGSDSTALDRSIVLVGLMGAGKTCIGRKLAARLGLDFTDADSEIEKAAGCTIEDYFATYGEAAFRDGERRVIARLLSGAPQVVSTGGGAFMDAGTRAEIRAHGISVWLRADLELLLKRTARRNNRPLLKRGDPRAILDRLIRERYPVYAEADVVVDSVDGPPEVTVENTLRAVEAFLAARATPDGPFGLRVAAARPGAAAPDEPAPGDAAGAPA
jgi:shikimate kinase